jgi:hypothetical protein
MTTEEQIAALIGLGPGYEVQIFGLVSVFRTEDGAYTVHQRTVDNGKSVFLSQTSHPTALEAATEFERIRVQRKLGYEFETETA